MNIRITAYGLGSGHDEAAGGSYDDTAIKQELARIKQALEALPSGAAYDDTYLRKQIEAVVEQVSKIADTRKEYQAAYVPKKDLGSELDIGFASIKFEKPFSKVPFVKATPNLSTGSAQVIYIINVTKTGFEIKANVDSNLSELKGVWYEAHLID